MAKRDYYEILGLDRGADDGAIKSAFRKKAMENHPDRNPDDAAAEQRFKEVNEAYEVLKDPQKRAAYDQFGHAAFEGGGPGGGQGSPFGGFEFNFGGGGFADIFEEMFGDAFGGRRGGRGGRRQAAGRGKDMRFNMDVTLEEAFTGKQANIRLPGSVSCESCSGSGAEGGAEPTTCPACNGNGQVRTSQGFFTVQRTCPQCQGSGEVISNPCKTCNGSGRQQKEKTLQVDVPSGVEDGTRIRLSGEGEAGVRGAPPGDLYIFVNVAPHDFFHREGAHIYCQVPIPFTRAALGGSIEVPTVEGTRAKVNVPAGTQTGDQFRLRGKGMTVLRSPARGDMYIEIAVETPTKLSGKAKKLLEQFEKEAGEAASPKAQQFFDKVKRLWEKT